MLQQAEHAVLRFLNTTCHCPALDKAMPYITEIGGGEVIFAVAVILLFFKERQKVKCGILLMAGSTFVYQLCCSLKGLIGRPRPFVVLSDIRPLVEADGFSCPSTHSALAFMAAFVLSHYLKKRPVFYSLAVVVAVSRIYLGVHYPSDVFAGAVLGTLAGFTLTVVSDRKNGHDPK